MRLALFLFHRVALALAATMSMHHAGAWGVQAHQTIALAAQGALSPAARAQVDRLLASEPGSTLASISTWADEHRGRTTASWHYLNFPADGCDYVRPRDCPDDGCIVEATKRQLDVLASPVGDHQKLLALKYVVHLVADAHQPLHAGYAADKGGNTYQVQAFGKGTNLHALWDTILVKRIDADADALALRILDLRPAVPERAIDASVATAVGESCRIVHDPTFYPSHILDETYVSRWSPVILSRMNVAAMRLAALLNAALK